MSEKFLIAIPTCHEYSGNPATANRNEEARRQACRDTWLKNCPADYRFFFGSGTRGTAPDEVILPCGDDYNSLSHKMRAICKWAIAQGYTRILRVDTDAYVYVDRFLKANIEHDYAGYTIDYPKHLEHARYASGAGFVLSRKAMDIVAANTPDDPADDLWTGRVLFQNGVKCSRETRFLCGQQPHYVDLKSLGKFHPYVVLHALSPDGLHELHSRGDAGYHFDPPAKPLNEPDFDFSYGRTHPECDCKHCKR